MAFKGLQNPASWRGALERARLNREALGEPRLGSTTYAHGVPTRGASEGMEKESGPLGKFAIDTNAKENEPYFRNYIARLGGFNAAFEAPEEVG